MTYCILIHIISIMFIFINYSNYSTYNTFILIKNSSCFSAVVSDDESLDLPILPDDRSQFDVHGALVDDKVKQLEYHVLLNTYDAHELCYYITYITYINYVD